MKMSNLTLKISVVGLVLIFLLCSFTPTFSQSVEVVNPGKVVIELIYNNYETINLDPAIVYDPLTGQICMYSYETLITPDVHNEGKFVGLLAENWTISADGTIYTFHLKDNVKYQDGTPFNAYTMKYSFDRVMLMNAGPAFALNEFIVGGPDLLATSDLNTTEANIFLQSKGITIKDEFTLEIRLIEAFEPFLSIFTYSPFAVSPYSIITNRPANYTTDQNDDLWGMVSLEKMFPGFSDWTKLGLTSNHDPKVSGIVPGLNSKNGHTWMQKNMVGTGPYKLVNLSIDIMKFIKNNDWHGTFVENSPEEIIYPTIPDPEILKLHFKLGENDMTGADPDNWLDFVDPYGNSKYEGITLYKQPKLATYVVLFNFNESLTKFVIPALDISDTWNQSHIIDDKLVRYSNNDTYFASLNNPFTALKFREAFSYVFDYESYIKGWYNGLLSERAEGVIPIGMIGHHDQLIELGLIPKMNLTKAYNLFKEVGWRGNITLLDYLYGSDPEPSYVNIKKTVESLDIGININIMKGNSFFQEIDQLPIIKTGWMPDFNDPYGVVYPMLHSEGRSNPNLPWRAFSYENPEIDLLIEQSRTERDSVTRLSLFKEIEELAASDYQAIYLENQKHAFFARDWLYNVEESGSLDPTMPVYVALRFQYISKGKPETTTTTTTTIPEPTTTTPPNGVGSPGFTYLITLAVIFPIIKKKMKRKR